MTSWTRDQLNRIGNAEELRIASLRRDGTLRKKVTIWVVRVDDDLFVRPVNGRTSAWFRWTQVRGEGCIWAGGLEAEVNFVRETDPAINEKIDAAYWSKYQRWSQYVPPVVTDKARAATLKLVSRA